MVGSYGLLEEQREYGLWEVWVDRPKYSEKEGATLLLFVKSGWTVWQDR